MKATQLPFVCLFGRAVVLNTVHNYFHLIQSNFVDQFIFDTGLASFTRLERECVFFMSRSPRVAEQ